MFWTLLTFSSKIIFRVSKRCSEALEQYFWDFASRKLVDEKKLFVFQRLIFLVSVSQLSTRDLFDFLGNLKIKQDIFLSWISRQVRSVEQRALWFPYSRLFFGIVFKRLLFLEYLGFLRSQLWCPFWIFWHISYRKMFEVLTCKKKS